MVHERCQKYAELQPFVFVDSNLLLVHVEVCLLSPQCESFCLVMLEHVPVNTELQGM